MSGSAASLTRSERAQTDCADFDLARADHGDALEVAEALGEVLLFLQADEHGRRLLAQASTIARACFVDGASNCDASITASVPSWA